MVLSLSHFRNKIAVYLIFYIDDLPILNELKDHSIDKRSPRGGLERPFTNEKLSTALSPILQRQKKERDIMLNEQNFKTEQSCDTVIDSHHMNSVLAKFNKSHRPIDILYIEVPQSMRKKI